MISFQKTQVLDDSVLLHLTKHTNHVEFDVGVFTARGLLDAFEVCFMVVNEELKINKDKSLTVHECEFSEPFNAFFFRLFAILQWRENT